MHRPKYGLPTSPVTATKPHFASSSMQIVIEGAACHAGWAKKCKSAFTSMSSAVETSGAQWQTTSKHNSSAEPVTLDPREGAALLSPSIIKSADGLFANLAP